VLGARYAQAVAWATELHAHQTRKVGDIPYLSHLLSVSAMVLEDDGDEDEAIAGLLHDAVEDVGGEPLLDEIRLRFGKKVADIVDGCSDSYGDPKPPWAERKQQYIDHLEEGGVAEPVLRVVAADKLHNARSVLVDLRRLGRMVFDAFNADADEVLWYYSTISRILDEQLPDSRSTIQLRDVVDQLAELLESATVAESA